MHEMSLALSILQLAEEEAARNGCDRLLRLRVDYGPLAGVMPDALDFCLRALLEQSPHRGASVELCATPLELRCAVCGASFAGGDRSALWNPCPACGANAGHIVERGRELLLAQIEARSGES